MPSEQAALTRLTSLLEFGLGTGRSVMIPEGRHRAVSYIITHLMDKEILGRVGARRKAAYGEATEDVGDTYSEGAHLEPRCLEELFYK